MSQYTINQSSNCLNTTNSYNTNVSNYTVADDRSELLTWLSPLVPSLRHRDVRERRVNNVGEWLMQTEEFERWSGMAEEGEPGSDNAALFCYGDPGVGKTFISSLVIDRLCDQARRQKIAVTCFYFDFAARKEQSATGMLGSLLKQIVSGMGRIPEEILQAFQQQRKAIGGCGPQLTDIVKMLQAITSSQPTFMCIDALDECVGVQRFRVLDSLKRILEKSPGTRIFVTGRPHIRAEIEKRLAGQMKSLSIGPSKADIITYLRARLSEDETPDAMDESLEAEILQRIPENISEMFLLASLNIDTILQESTIYRRRERLARMTDGLGLGDAYGATIERIKAQGGDKSRLGMEALMWVSHVERPLRADELCHALAVELGSKHFNTGNVPSMATLLSCCQGLITVDKEASTVRLIHFTLQEYLSSYPNIFNRPHSAIAEICLTFLNSKQVKAIPANRTPDLSNTPFLEYGSLYWGVHAKRELSDCASSLALELFQEYEGHVSTRLLLEQTRYLVNGIDTSFLFNGLHCASLFGIVEVAAALIETECHDINGGDFKGLTPLAWAAQNGHEGVVKILLAREEVNPGKPDWWGWTPLSHAASGGHEGVVKILLAREQVNPDKPDRWGQKPLLYATSRGHEQVVKILLGREEVNPDKPDNFGQTPLMRAAVDGHKRVTELLQSHKAVTYSAS